MLSTIRVNTGDDVILVTAYGDRLQCCTFQLIDNQDYVQMLFDESPDLVEVHELFATSIFSEVHAVFFKNEYGQPAVVVSDCFIDVLNAAGCCVHTENGL